MNKAMIESYLRNLLGSVLGAITIVMGSTGIASPLEFGGSEWLLVANALWASAVPTLLRWVNKKDPAFGLVAKAVTSSVTKKLEEATVEAAKKPAAKKAAGEKKSSTKKTTTKKPSGGGSAKTKEVA
jgi:type IV secretory pathway TrbD component